MVFWSIMTIMYMYLSIMYRYVCVCTKIWKYCIIYHEHDRLWFEYDEHCPALFYVYQVIDKSQGIADIPRWFEGSLLNYAENLLSHEGNKVAVYAAGELTNKWIQMNDIFGRGHCSMLSMQCFGSPKSRLTFYAE